MKPTTAATTYTDPETGEAGYLDLDHLHIEELDYKSGQETKRYAVVQAKVESYA